MDITFEIVEPNEHHPNHYLVLAALEPGLSTARVTLYNNGMKMNAGTIQEFFEALVADLSREPKDDQERQQIETEKKAIREAFERMATPDPELEGRLSPRVKEWLEKRFPSNPKPLPPLPPGKSRIVSFD